MPCGWGEGAVARRGAAFMLPPLPRLSPPAPAPALSRPSPPPSWGTTPAARGWCSSASWGAAWSGGNSALLHHLQTQQPAIGLAATGDFLVAMPPGQCRAFGELRCCRSPPAASVGWAGWVPQLVMLVVHRQGGQRQLRHLTGVSISRNDRNCVLLLLPLLEGVRASCARGLARLAHGEGWLGAPAASSAAWGCVCPRRFCIKPKVRILVMGTGFGVYGGLSLGLFHVPGSRFWRRNKEILSFRMGLLFKE